ncbi:MAG TPA: choice-of-anchor tandem repeat GloVer-containing protein [Rhizomicrobium sp.]|nr:choice-of-anchor tandem repeat GloVer-containing protein [Rhizomicrobium sp.]
MSEPRRQIVSYARPLLLAALWMAMSGAAAAAGGYEQLYSLPATPPGQNPVAPVTFDTSGNIYGVSSAEGSVFELVRGGNGSWTEKTLYTFTGGSDGRNPWGGLVFDGKSNLFGTAEGGGGTGCPEAQGCGTVFELTPNQDGGWTESTVYRFAGSPDGQWPASSLVFDSAGNLFGTTSGGGDDTNCNTANVGYGCGTVFELAPRRDGTWKEMVLYTFPGGHGDAYPQYAAPVLDAAGNLYGTTAGASSGTPEGKGTVFKLVRGAKGVWTHKILYRFPGTDGLEYPQAGVVFDAKGNLYGTTQGDTPAGDCCGTVFEIVHSKEGWKEKTLHRFTGADGAFPAGGVVFDKSGNLYAAPTGGGTLGECFAGCGTVIELSPSKGGWTETVLHQFGGSGDGYNPFAGLARYKNVLAGTTIWGGPNIYGTVYEITP